MVNQTLEFRQATKADLEFLVDLREMTINEHLENSGLTIDDAMTLEKVKYKYVCAKIVVIDGNDVGLLKVDKSARPWYIEQIQVLPCFQGKGIGEKVIQRLLAEAKSQNTDVSLSVLKCNPAKKLYERIGFSVIEESEIKFKMKFTV